MNIQLLIAPTNYNVSNNVDTISVDTSSGGITNIYLQKISPATPRRTIFVVDISGNASVGNIKIYTFAGDSINFQSSISLDVDGIIAEIVEADGDAYICNLSTDDSAPSTNGHIIQDNGTPLPQRQNLNFIGGNVTDDALNNATKVQFNADKNYVQQIVAPSITWSVPHNLNKRCAVQVVDNSFNEIEAKIHWVDNNEVEITFNALKSGWVYCN